MANDSERVLPAGAGAPRSDQRQPVDDPGHRVQRSRASANRPRPELARVGDRAWRRTTSCTSEAEHLLHVAVAGRSSARGARSRRRARPPPRRGGTRARAATAARDDHLSTTHQHRRGRPGPRRGRRVRAARSRLARRGAGKYTLVMSGGIAQPGCSAAAFSAVEKYDHSDEAGEGERRGTGCRRSARSASRPNTTVKMAAPTRGCTTAHAPPKTACL